VKGDFERNFHDVSSTAMILPIRLKRLPDGQSCPRIFCPDRSVFRQVQAWLFERRLNHPAGTFPEVMHRTETLDYAILLKGQCDLELDDGKTVRMKAGDICVQRGTMHAWVPTGGPCTFAFILIDADPVEAGGQKLTTHYPTA